MALLFPFSLLTYSPSLASTIEIPGSHYRLPGLRVNPIFQLSSPLFPLTDSFPGITGSCHLNSHQFTRGEGVVSFGNPPSPLQHALLLFPRPHTHFSVPLIDRPLISGITHTMTGTWLIKRLKHWWIPFVSVLMSLVITWSSYQIPAQNIDSLQLLFNKTGEEALGLKSKGHVNFIEDLLRSNGRIFPGGPFSYKC